MHNAKLTAQPASDASSGNRPKATTPSSTPALNGIRIRARRFTAVSQRPSTAPAIPTRAAKAGGSRARVSENVVSNSLLYQLAASQIPKLLRDPDRRVEYLAILAFGRSELQTER